MSSDSCCRNEDEGFDPRIKDELERMNATADEINRLEKELDEARSKFRQTLTESSSKLKSYLKKHKRSIEKSRTYFETASEAKKVQGEAQHAAVEFRRANSFYRAAKETIHLAEQRLQDDGVNFDEAWQEMLNHSTIKMMDAEKDKMRSELEHHRKSLVYQDLDSKAHRLERSLKRSISNAKPYYELKAQLELQLQQQKQNVNDLQTAVNAAKMNYKAAMSQLEKISEEIHEQRKMIDLPLLREPGVGCESDEEFPQEIDLEKHLELEGSWSDDCISSDASSVWSYDSSSVTTPSICDRVSLSSNDHDSAICSPKSLSLERKFSDCMKIMPPSIVEADVSDGINVADADNVSLTQAYSDDTLMDGESDNDEACRTRASTITITAGNAACDQNL